MKNKGYIIFGMITGILLTLAVFWNMSSSQAYAQPDLASSSSTVTPGAPVTDEGGNTAPLQANNSSDEQIPPNIPAGSLAQPLALLTQVPGETTVYFVPTDNDNTATVLYLYNTDTVSHVVVLRGFSYNGTMNYSWTINIGAASFLRVASDDVVLNPPPSWTTPAPIIVNFTDFTYFASLSLPKGVKVEGYTLFNPSGLIDPRANQETIPLRFSSDPATVFLPAMDR